MLRAALVSRSEVSCHSPDTSTGAWPCRWGRAARRTPSTCASSARSTQPDHTCARIGRPARRANAAIAPTAHLGPTGPAGPGSSPAPRAPRWKSLGSRERGARALVQEVRPRVSATRAWTHARRCRAFARLFEPGCLRETARCAFFKRFCARRGQRGLSIGVPNCSAAKSVRPRSSAVSASLPSVLAWAGSVASPASATEEAKWRPARSRMTVADDGGDGRSRDERTATSPMRARRSRPSSRMLKRLVVRRIAWRRSLRELSFG